MKKTSSQIQNDSKKKLMHKQMTIPLVVTSVVASLLLILTIGEEWIFHRVLEVAHNAHKEWIRYIYLTVLMVPLIIVTFYYWIENYRVYKRLYADIERRIETERQLDESRQTFRSLYEYYPDMIIKIDDKGNLVELNPVASQIMGYTVEDVAGRPYQDFVAPHEQRNASIYYNLAAAGDVQQYQTTILHKDGRHIDISIRSVPVIVNGVHQGLYLIAKDLTQEKLLNKKLSLNEERLENLSKSMEFVTWYQDVRTDQITYSSGSEQLYGYTEDKFNQDPELWKKVIVPEDIPVVDEMQKRLFQGESIHYEYRIHHANGQMKWVRDHVIPVFNANGQVIGYSGVIIDITEQKQAQARMHYLAFHDDLTGLPNRRSLMDSLLESIKKKEFSVFSLLVVDVDRFKNVNDQYGYFFGDQVIKKMAEKLQYIVDGKGIVYRYGGDDFVLFLPRMDRESTVSLAGLLLDEFHQPLQIGGFELSLSITMGISIYPHDGIYAESLLQNADTAFRKAKDNARSSFMFFDVRMNEEIARSITLERSLAKAIGDKQFHVVYQPLVDISTQTIYSAEALIRWDHPVLGTVSPATFIPLAEESGLITQIGEYVIEEVCSQQAMWRKKGRKMLPISVNLSPVQLKQSTILNRIRQLLEKYELEPSLLMFEITETASMENMEATELILENLRKEGHSIVIDDFGQGHSSFAYITRLPIDGIKMDRAFIRDIHLSYKDQAIVNALLAVAEALNLKIVAEGVETEEQLQLLRELGCKIVQGYYFSKPVSGQQLEKDWL